ncbi:citrate lyase subunit gamma (acyl carrier protein) [Orbus hercynius]|uniref:Citrate lyase acyl carrier protein n=1 Tax=Orbus hercynius TaxID=593135 RepID=A0A495RJK5_9GAMM|nr:citrate lyase acyl carrier protein [Orbus hercynius]RKS87722.1 citrate lyase subunit gamma (acyl carrier protein) [Orbus hercynius]
MKIIKSALAGTLESSDLLVKVEPHDRLEIVINSDVNKQFGQQIRQVVEDTLARLEVKQGLIIIDDKGALDCVITARVQIAISRAAAEKAQWSQLL